YDAFGALGMLEERSYASGRIGEKVFDKRFSLADDAVEPRGLPKKFDFEGTPKRRVELVEDGVLRSVLWDRATAKRAGGGQQTTGHAPPASMRSWGPVPYALSVSGGEAASTEEPAERRDPPRVPAPPSNRRTAGSQPKRASPWSRTSR